MLLKITRGFSSIVPFRLSLLTHCLKLLCRLLGSVRRLPWTRIVYWQFLKSVKCTSVIFSCHNVSNGDGLLSCIILFVEMFTSLWTFLLCSFVNMLQKIPTWWHPDRFSKVLGCRFVKNWKRVWGNCNNGFQRRQESPLKVVWTAFKGAEKGTYTL